MIVRAAQRPGHSQLRSQSHLQPRRQNAGWIELAICCLMLLFIYSGVVMYLGATESILKPIYIHSSVVLAAMVFAWPTFANRAYRPYILPITIIAILYVSMILFQMILLPRVDYRLVYERLVFAVVLIAAAVLFVRVKSPDIVLWVLRVVVVVSCGIIVSEQIFNYNLYPTSQYWGRAAGLVGNPNAASMYIASALPLMMFRVNRALVLFFITVTFCGIFATFSRSGVLLWVAAVVLFYMLPADGRFTAKLVLRLVLFAIASVVLILSYETLVKTFVVIADPILTDNTRNRLLTTQDDAARERLAVLRGGWESFLTAPIFGKGVGSAWNWQSRTSVHNQIVLVLVEQGIIGFAWLCAFLYALGRNRWPFGAWLIAIFLVASPFTHNYFDQSLSSVLIALYIMVAVKFPAVATAAERSRRAVHRPAPALRRTT